MRIALALVALAAVVAVVAWPRPEDPAPVEKTKRSVEPAPVEAEPECVMPDELPPASKERLRHASLDANELSAVATLTNLVSSQAHYQATALGDADQDGEGEYGTLRALTSARPPLLPNSFSNVVDGRLELNGYYFRLHVPADTDRAERVWCCYAWPVRAGQTGNRTFFVSQWGDVLANPDGRYSGDKEPAATAAFAPGARDLTGDIVVDAKGGDGSIWRVVR